MTAELIEEVAIAVENLQKSTGKRFGDPKNPLLVSVRSGAKFSMPGMMETVLNVGISPEIAQSLAELTDEARFACDSYRRYIDMYGRTICGISNEIFDEVRVRVIAAHGARDLSQLSASALREIGE